MVLSEAACDAAMYGDLRGVEVALATGTDVNDMTLDGLTMLVISVEDGHYDVARFLLEHGANPNLIADEGDFTPLIVAKTAPSIDLLVAHGAELDYQETAGGNTALHERAGYPPTAESYDAVRALLRHGASTKLENNDGRNAVEECEFWVDLRGRQYPSPNISLCPLRLLRQVSTAGSWTGYLREPVVQLLALRYLSLAGRASAPANLLRLFGAPPVRNAGKARTRARRAASSAARTPLPEEVFKLVLGFWNERV
tara:strand:- start:60 stop:824 length:765 start_codon:yes stop_codon:yes gene_type:complete